MYVLKLLNNVVQAVNNVEAVNAALTRWGLKVHWEKSKVMRVARKGEEFQVMIGDE